MARLFPTLSSCDRKMTSGERRLAQRFESLLEDDYLVWYDVPVGPKHQHPDFVVLHPHRGLLILEVKDWIESTILEANRASFVLSTGRGPTYVANPLEQARQNAYAVKQLLEADPSLLAQTGAHKGKLIVPYGYGVVLTKLSRKAFEASGLDNVLDPSRVICQDEMLEAVEPLQFQQRLWNMQSAPFTRLLTLPQVDRIRWHLFPEIRITAPIFPDACDDATSDEPLSDIVRVMDLQQEQLARSLGEGHRVIHGVAGSGKTLILGYRCQHLARALAKPILVLCYNRALATQLEHVMQRKGLGGKVVVQTFHSWCNAQIELYHVRPPARLPGQDVDLYYEAMVDSVIAGVDRGQIPRAQYGAVLVDEGHDFEPDWLRLVAQMVDPETNALLVLYDDAQSIYRRGGKPKFTFASVGIQAKGRTTILRLNYRNTREVLALAYDFARDLLHGEAGEEDGVPVVEPASAGRHGRPPELVRRNSLKEEAAAIAEWLEACHEGGRAWSDMAVLYGQKFVAQEILAALAGAGIPHQWVSREAGGNLRLDIAADRVRVMTIHSSKGLEFPVVVIPGIGFMPRDPAEASKDARVLYVAMTRSTDRLLMSCHRQSAFAKRIARGLTLVARPEARP